MKCNNCNTKMEKLKYYYDDDWGHKGTKVWSDKGTEMILKFCPKCGNVQVEIGSK